MSGTGTPVTGKRPIVIPIFTMKLAIINIATPAPYNISKFVAPTRAMDKIRPINIAKRPNKITTPKKPHSSAYAEKIKSV
jgi:hypothetical protein